MLVDGLDPDTSEQIKEYFGGTGTAHPGAGIYTKLGRNRDSRSWCRHTGLCRNCGKVQSINEKPAAGKVGEPVLCSGPEACGTEAGRGCHFISKGSGRARALEDQSQHLSLEAKISTIPNTNTKLPGVHSTFLGSNVDTTIEQGTPKDSTTFIFMFV